MPETESRCKRANVACMVVVQEANRKSSNRLLILQWTNPCYFIFWPETSAWLSSVAGWRSACGEAGRSPRCWEVRPRSYQPPQTSASATSHVLRNHQRNMCTGCTENHLGVFEHKICIGLLVPHIFMGEFLTDISCVLRASKKTKSKPNDAHIKDIALHRRILVVCALPLGQRVLITDAGHQIAEAGYPGSGLLCVWCHQVQGLHVVPVVHRETAGWVEAAVRMPMEDVRLTALGDFVQGIDGDWQKEDVENRKEKKTSLVIE